MRKPPHERQQVVCSHSLLVHAVLGLLVLVTASPQHGDGAALAASVVVVYQLLAVLLGYERDLVRHLVGRLA